MKLTEDITRTHMQACASYAQSSPDHMLNVGLMVITSIRNSWYRVGEDMLRVADKGINSTVLNLGSRRRAYGCMRDNKEAMFAAMMATDNQEDLLDLFSAVPGIGLVKAGFMVQLCKGFTGCIDSHNAKLYDVNLESFALRSHTSAKVKASKIAAYAALCKELGGAIYLWREWCEHMAAIHPSRFDSAYEVSLRHVQYLSNTPCEHMF